MRKLPIQFLKIKIVFNKLDFLIYKYLKKTKYIINYTPTNIIAY